MVGTAWETMALECSPGGFGGANPSRHIRPLVKPRPARWRINGLLSCGLRSRLWNYLAGCETVRPAWL